MKKYLIFALASMLFTGCVRKSLIGDCSENPYGLPTRNVTFDADASTKVITAKYRWEAIMCYTQDKSSLKGDFEIICSEDGCTEEHFYYIDTRHLLTIIGDWFEIKENSYKELSISVSKNETNIERILHIGFEAGNCLDAMTVTQKAD